MSRHNIFLACVVFTLGTVTGYGDTIRVPDDAPTIQAAINMAAQLDTIIVNPGTYHEAINFSAKLIRIQSIDPSDPATIAATTIDGGGAQTVVAFSGIEDARTVLDGMTITGALQGRTGINCFGAAPLVRNCVVQGGFYGISSCNGTIEKCDVFGTGGAAVFNSRGNVARCMIHDNLMFGFYSNGGNISRCTVSRNLTGFRDCIAGSSVDNCVVTANDTGFYSCSSSLSNLTITGNRVGIQNYGVTPVRNCIIWDNQLQLGSSSPIVSFSDIQGGFQGTGNIQQNPLFVAPGYWDHASGGVWHEGDYRLTAASPCVDSGDPADSDGDALDLLGAPRIVGSRIDMGAIELPAPCEQDCDPDIDGDGIPNSIDFCNDTAPGTPVDEYGVPRTDYNYDCRVDLRDYAVFQNSITGP